MYSGDQSIDELFFRTIFFKIFNKIETWAQVEEHLGTVCWSEYNFERYAECLDAIRARGISIYSSAYIMPSPSFGEKGKHRNHLRLIEQMMRDDVPNKVANATSLQQVFQVLKQYRSLGRFLAFQFAIDLNYSSICNFSEMDFVVAGPGASDGIKKCFMDTGGLSEEDIIRFVADHAQNEFERLGITFANLWGRELQLIDCQNLFCEVDKYSRVVHPEYHGISGRTRIKQRFVPIPKPIEQWYPPKWKIQVPERSQFERNPELGRLPFSRHTLA